MKGYFIDQGLMRIIYLQDVKKKNVIAKIKPAKISDHTTVAAIKPLNSPTTFTFSKFCNKRRCAYYKFALSVDVTPVEG